MTNPPTGAAVPQDVPAVPLPISLRDWFAGQALAGICANSAWDENGWPARAKAAYDAADALLSARGETK